MSEDYSDDGGFLVFLWMAGGIGWVINIIRIFLCDWNTPWGITEGVFRIVLAILIPLGGIAGFIGPWMGEV